MHDNEDTSLVEDACDELSAVLRELLKEDDSTLGLGATNVPNEMAESRPALYSILTYAAKQLKEAGRRNRLQSPMPRPKGSRRLPKRTAPAATAQPRPSKRSR